MTIARLIYYIIPDQKVWGIRATLLTKLFVWLDVVAFLVQSVGGTLLSAQEEGQGESNVQRVGQKVYMTGIGLQAAFIVIFSALTTRFYVQMRTQSQFGRNIRRAKILTWVMYAVFALIMVSIRPAAPVPVPRARPRARLWMFGLDLPYSPNKGPHHLPPGRICSRSQPRESDSHQRRVHARPRRLPGLSWPGAAKPGAPGNGTEGTGQRIPTPVEAREEGDEEGEEGGEEGQGPTEKGGQGQPVRIPRTVHRHARNVRPV
jgi:hypothetical protein